MTTAGKGMSNLKGKGLPEAALVRNQTDEKLFDVSSEAEGRTSREADAVSAAIQQSVEEVHVDEVSRHANSHVFGDVQIHAAPEAIEEDSVGFLHAWTD